MDGSPGPRNVARWLLASQQRNPWPTKPAQQSLGLSANSLPSGLGRPNSSLKLAMLVRKVDLKPIMDKVIEQAIPTDLAVTDASKAHNAAIERTFDTLWKTASNKGGSLSPVEADEMIRRVLNPKAYTASETPPLHLSGRLSAMCRIQPLMS